MRLACLVLAYGAAPVLKHAAPIYHAAGWDIFVHVDPKAGQSRYAGDLGEIAALCHFVADPVKVFWGGYSMMEAEIKLICAAQKVGQYDKYLLLSDDSFPAIPASALTRHFDNDEDQLTMERQRDDSPFYARYQAFFCYDHEATAVRSVQTPGRNTVARAIDERLEQKLAEIAMLRWKGKKPIDVYYGSQFWALTANSIDLILDIVARDLHLRKSFEFSALPDEIMFQSILGNHLHKRRMDTGPVYVDFSSGGPRVIERVEDLPRDLQAPHAFIRKISPNDPAFLSNLVQRLNADETIGGVAPGGSRMVQQTALQAGRTQVTIRLAAPAENAGPSWHGMETFWGRQYRWTASDRVRWSMAMDIAAPGTVRFVITTVVSSGTDWMKGCKLVFDGQVAPMQIVSGELMAEFEHAGLGAVVVELQTPTLKSPSDTIGSHDTRRLGLSVAS